MKEGAINFAPSFYLIPQTKNPTNVGLNWLNNISYNFPIFNRGSSTKIGNTHSYPYACIGSKVESIINDTKKTPTSTRQPVKIEAVFISFILFP